MSGTTAGPAETKAVQWAIRHPRFLQSLPPEDEEPWRAIEFFESRPYPADFWNALRRNILEPADKVRRVGHGEMVNLYRVSEKGRQIIARNNLADEDRTATFGLSTDPRCPVCESQRFENARGVEGLRCKHCENVTPKGEWS